MCFGHVVRCVHHDDYWPIDEFCLFIPINAVPCVNACGHVCVHALACVEKHIFVFVPRRPRSVETTKGPASAEKGASRCTRELANDKGASQCSLDLYTHVDNRHTCLNICLNICLNTCLRTCLSACLNICHRHMSKHMSEHKSVGVASSASSRDRWAPSPHVRAACIRASARVNMCACMHLCIAAFFLAVRHNGSVVRNQNPNF